jgi:hypothetical protein
MMPDLTCFARDESGDILIPMRLVFDLEACLILVRDQIRTWRGEWFLDLTAGTPWLTSASVAEGDAILGSKFDAAKVIGTLRGIIIAVPGVTDCTVKVSFDGSTRGMAVSATVSTRWGEGAVTA